MDISMKPSREFLAVGLWVAAFALNSYSAAEYLHREPDAMLALGWGLFVGQIALVVTGWCIAQRAIAKRGVDVEQVVEVVDALHRASADTVRLPSR